MITLSQAEAQAILSSYDKNVGNIAIQQINTGYHATVFHLSTDGKELIVKVGNSHEFQKNCEKEANVFDLLRKADIPVPEVLMVDFSEARVPYSFIMTSKVSGTQMNQVDFDSLSKARKQSLYEELGNYVARMHAINNNVFGDSWKGESFTTWSSALDSQFEQQLRVLQGTVFEESRRKMKEYFDANKAIVDLPTAGSFLHMDLHRGNIFVENNHITGFIDPGDALWGSNEYDLMRLELAHFSSEEENTYKQFFTSYERHGGNFLPGYKKRRALYWLTRVPVSMGLIVTFLEKYSEYYDRAVLEEQTSLDRFLKEGVLEL